MMMDKEKLSRSLNAADKIKKLLFNYDLELVAARSELQLVNSKIDRYQNSTNKRNRNIYLANKIEKIKIEEFIRQLGKAKNETWNDLEQILNTYTPRYRTLWIMRFIKGMSYEEISADTNYSISNVRKIIDRMNRDLIDYFEGVDFNENTK